MHSLNTFGARMSHGLTRTHKTHHGPDLGEATTFPLKMYSMCRDPSFGLTTKARVCKNVGQEGSPGVTFQPPGSAKECEGMNSHIPKVTLTLGIKVSMDPQIFRE